MKNIINEKPTLELNNRMKEDVSFVSDKDIKGKKVLDIGCGFGWCELNFLNRGVKKIVGTELSTKDLKVAKKNLKDKRVELKVGSAIDLPFNRNSFDTVVSWEVIEHIPKNTEDAMFKEVYRVLKKGGSFYLSTPYDNFLSKIMDPAWWLIGHRHYSLEKLKYFAKQNGFKLKSHRIKGRIWSLMALDNMYISKWLFKRRPFFQELFDRKEEAEYKTTGYANIFAKFEKV